MNTKSSDKKDKRKKTVKENEQKVKHWVSTDEQQSLSEMIKETNIILDAFTKMSESEEEIEQAKRLNKEFRRILWQKLAEYKTH